MQLDEITKLLGNDYVTDYDEKDDILQIRQNANKMTSCGININHFSQLDLNEDDIEHIKESLEKPPFDTDKMHGRVLDADEWRNNSHVRLVGNNKYYSNAYGKEYMGMKKIVLLDIEVPEGTASVVLNEELADKLSIDENIFDRPVKNTDYMIMGMNQFLCSLIGMPLCLFSDEQEALYVISNQNLSYGASILLDLKELEHMLSQKNITDALIIPSSVHELIVMNANDIPAEIDKAYVKQLIPDVNVCATSAKDFLSDDLYRYKDGMLYKA